MALPRSITQETRLLADGTAPPVELAARVPEDFESYLQRIVHQWTQTIAVLGFTLVPLFLILDYFTMPEGLLRTFFWYRAVTTAIVLLQFFVIRATRPGPNSYLHGYFFTAVVGYMIVRMTVDLGGYDSAYYAGLNLVLVAVNVLLPWKPIHSAINGALVVVMYLAVNALTPQDYHVETLINNLYFLCSTVIIAVAINATKHRLVEEEFHLRAELLSTNARLDTSRQDLKRARDALWGEMEIAKRIQTALLPRNRTVGNYDIAALMQPAAEVGGDYYDIIDNPNQEHWVALGDVSGHGVESGLVMMMTQTSISSVVVNNPGLTPSAVFAAANTVLKENIQRLDSRRYVTLSINRLHEDHFVTAGRHQDILVWRAATGQIETIPAQGCWLGIVEDARPFNEDRRVAVNVGDVVLLFTDGVTEANAADGTMFGQERLAEALGRVARGPLDEGLKAILEEVWKFQAKQDDDFTVLMMRRTR